MSVSHRLLVSLSVLAATLPLARTANSIQVPLAEVVAPVEPGQFSIVGGKIIEPGGSPWLAHGINVYVGQLSQAVSNAQATPLLKLFPGLNQVRIVFRNAWDTSAATATAIDRLTALKIVVILDDHVLGNSAPLATGTKLAGEHSWFTYWATKYKTNPYVWFQGQNEPGDGRNLAALALRERDFYNWVRDAGNGNIVVMSEATGGNKNLVGSSATGYDGAGPMTPSVYATMRNIIWDLHFYNFITVPAYSSDINVLKTAFQGSVSAGYGVTAAQSIRSADGLVPVIIDEFGNSTTGGTADKGGSNLVDVVMNSGFSWSAFTWGFPGINACCNDLLSGTALSLSPYGTQVARGIAAAAAGQPPPPVVVTGPESSDGTVVTGVGPMITDGQGNTFAISSGAKVVINGVADQPTKNVDRLAYSSHVFWQRNTGLDWYRYNGTPGSYTGPTKVSPVTEVVIPPPCDCKPTQTSAP